MKTLWKLTTEAARYKALYILAILSTLCLTIVNLTAPKLLSAMTGLVGAGLDEAGLNRVIRLALGLLGLYLLRILFRFGSNYLTHKAAWHLVGDLRSRLYNKLQSLDLGFFHDKQTGDLMSRVINDTRDFELLYAHMIPDILTNVATFVGVLVILLTVNWKLALITCCPIPLILLSGVVFSKIVRPFFKASQKSMGELNAQLQDSLSGLHEIQAFGQEKYESQRVQEKNLAQVGAMLRALRQALFSTPAWNSCPLPVLCWWCSSAASWPIGGSFPWRTSLHSCCTCHCSMPPFPALPICWKACNSPWPAPSV